MIFTNPVCVACLMIRQLTSSHLSQIGQQLEARDSNHRYYLCNNNCNIYGLVKAGVAV